MIMRILLIFILGIISISLSSQSLTSRNNIYGEYNGNVALLSINYERLLRNNNNINYTLRAGISYLDVNPFTNENTLIIPVSFSVLKNITKKIYFEARLFAFDYFWRDIQYGMGGSMVISNTSRSTFLLGGGLGLRMQPQTRGLFAQIHLNIHAPNSYIKSEPKNPWISFGAGYAF
jgi:hypothetical protein